MINITNPAIPLEIGSYDLPGYAISVAVTGNYVYVLGSYLGLYIIQIWGP